MAKRSDTYLELRTSLGQGSRGGQVKMLQDFLGDAGYFDGASDGNFGIMLSKAVRSWQKDHGLRVTGEVTPRIWEAMFARSRRAAQE